MTMFKNGLLGSAAAIAMVAGSVGTAFAFDEVNWTWDKEVIEDVDINVTIDTDVDTTGITEIEKLQIQIGDVNAVSSVSGVQNNQPVGAGGGVGTFNETFTFNTNLDESAGVMGVNPIDPAGPITQNGVTATFDGGAVDQASGMAALDPTELTFSVEGTVMVDPTDSFDARTELPTVDSAATAVGNNQAITSDVATYLHDAQFLFDQGPAGDDDFGLEDVVGGIAALGLGAQFSGNTHTALAVGASVLGITGTIAKADISATSEVEHILNARVDSSATAVGNNLSVDVNPDGAPQGVNTSDSVLIADLTQFALADISASSTVTGVSVNSYTNLGDASVSPLVGSVATAVGNNVTVNVGNVGN